MLHRARARADDTLAAVPEHVHGVTPVAFLSVWRVCALVEAPSGV